MLVRNSVFFKVFKLAKGVDVLYTLDGNRRFKSIAKFSQHMIS